MKTCEGIAIRNEEMPWITSKSITSARNRLYGPKPPTTFWLASPNFVTESLTQDTRPRLRVLPVFASASRIQRLLQREDRN